eukprot:TRINITY_DN21402_c0_g1_i1.p1 TRINITY_DN21402_c0_g1~~TRINITY_DN21402_c0_g1_i1.p1  ORF type:complete len:406 (+),score=126.38 TRINITY_DN21402_c0_g1_i1:80-1297(+)
MSSRPRGRAASRGSQQKQDQVGWGAWAASGMKKTGQMLGVVAPEKTRRSAPLPAGLAPDAEECEMGEYGAGGNSGGSSDESLRTFRGHTSSVYGCVFAPGQSRFLTGGRDKTLRLWQLPEFGAEKVKVFDDHSGFVLACDFAATKKHVCSASEDGNVYIYETAGGTRAATLKGHSSKVYAVHYTPCTSLNAASTIVSASLDRTVRLWDADTGQQELRLDGHTDNVFAAQWSRSGELIASAGDDLRVCLWDPREGRTVYELSGHKRTIWNLHWAADDLQLASCGMGAELRVWDMRQRREFASANGCHHGTPTHQALFSPDGSAVITCGRDKLVQVRKNAAGLPLLYELRGHNGTVYHMDLHPDGEQLLTSSVDCTLKMWRLRDSAAAAPPGAAAGAAAADAAAEGR